jgi:hypothetical protein
MLEERPEHCVQCPPSKPSRCLSVLFLSKACLERYAPVLFAVSPIPRAMLFG